MNKVTVKDLFKNDSIRLFVYFHETNTDNYVFNTDVMQRYFKVYISIKVSF